MVIYTNEDSMICAVNETDRTDLTMYEIDNDTFAGKCHEYIFGYKYEPTFEIEYNYDGEFPEAVTDEDGNPVYVLDENGERKVVGYSLYPWMDFTQLCLLQAEYERDCIREENTVLQMALCDQYEENLVMADDLANTQIALCEQYESNLQMSEDLENAQLALCDVYEQLINLTDAMEGE